MTITHYLILIKNEKAMKKKYKLKRLVIVLLVSMVIINSCCYVAREYCWFCIPPGEGYAGYELIIPVRLYPAKDTFRVGDTIYIESVFSDSVYDRSTGRKFLIEDMNWIIGSIIFPIHLDTKMATGYRNFQVIVPEEYDFEPVIFSTGTIRYEGTYNYDGSIYSLKFQLIPRDTGIYYFIFSIDDHFFTKIEFKEKCSSAIVYVYATMNEGSDNNIHLFKESPNEFFRVQMFNRPEEGFYKAGGYCFVVVE